MKENITTCVGFAVFLFLIFGFTFRYTPNNRYEDLSKISGSGVISDTWDKTGEVEAGFSIRADNNEQYTIFMALKKANRKYNQKLESGDRVIFSGYVNSEESSEQQTWILANNIMTLIDIKEIDANGNLVTHKQHN